MVRQYNTDSNAKDSKLVMIVDLITEDPKLKCKYEGCKDGAIPLTGCCPVHTLAERDLYIPKKSPAHSGGGARQAVVIRENGMVRVGGVHDMGPGAQEGSESQDYDGPVHRQGGYDSPFPGM